MTEDARRQWRQQATDVAQACRDLLDSVPLTYQERTMMDPKVLAIMLMSRSLGNFQAALQLVDSGMVPEARILVRCCFENSFWMVGLLAEGAEFVKKIQYDEMFNRKMLSELALEKHKKLDEAVEQGLRQKLRTIKEHLPKSGKLTPQKVALGGLLDISYALYCQLSGDSAHPSLTAVLRHSDQCVSADQMRIAIVPDPKESEIVQTLDWACLAQLAVYAGLLEIITGAHDHVRLHELMGRQRSLSGI